MLSTLYLSTLYPVEITLSTENVSWGETSKLQRHLDGRKDNVAATH